MQAEFQRQLQMQMPDSAEPMEEESLRSGKQTKKRPPSKMAPFPSTIRNADSMNDNSFDHM
jgi:hypothetical protein